jgi:hypothetical protein
MTEMFGFRVGLDPPLQAHLDCFRGPVLKWVADLLSIAGSIKHDQT